MKTPKALEDSIAYLCEKLPGNLTIFENNGKCSINSGECCYSKISDVNVSKRKIIYCCSKKNHIFMPLTQQS